MHDFHQLVSKKLAFILFNPGTVLYLILGGNLKHLVVVSDNPTSRAQLPRGCSPGPQLRQAKRFPGTDATFLIKAMMRGVGDHGARRKKKASAVLQQLMQ